MAKNIQTNYDRITAMTVDELAAFLAKTVESGGSLITIADSYICRRCKKAHDGHCPIDLDQDRCLYDTDDTQTIKYWLEGEVEE